MRLAVLGVVVAAVATELAKPEDERTWHGKVLEVVPYDFRPPTWDRIRDAYWNPNSERLFSERVFGVGWAVNLYQARVLLQEVFGRLMGSPEAAPIRIRMRSRHPAENPDAAPTKK